MGDAMQAGGSPIEVELGGKVYRFAPLDFGDFCDFEAWVCSRKVEQALSGLPESITGADRVALIRDIVMMDLRAAVQSEAASFSGMRQHILMSLRKGDPGVTVEDVNELLSVRSVSEIMAIVDGVSHPGEVEGEKGPKKPRARGPRSSRH